MKRDTEIKATIVRVKRKERGHPVLGAPMSEAQMRRVRAGGKANAEKRRARKAAGEPRYGREPSQEQLDRAERRRRAEQVVEDARVYLFEQSQGAAEALVRVRNEEVDPALAPSVTAAAKSILAKAGIADLTAVEHRGDAPLIVNLGPMDKYPKAGADLDGLEEGGE